MDFFEILKAIILGIVQGITEWLPVSSTGHLILVEELIPFKLSDIFVSTFKVVIQLGSILAVVVLFFNKIYPFGSNKSPKEKKQTFTLWTKIVIGTIPAGIVGLLFEDLIDKVLYNPLTVALTLILYGVLFIVLENRKKKPQINDLTQLSFKTALGIGLFQILALIPGTSRSGSTIIGGVILGTSRYIAAEFSFFLAIPIMFAASGLKLLKALDKLVVAEWLTLGVGFFVSFIVSIFAIKFLMDYIKKHDFKAFGYYRIVIGILVLLYFNFIG